MAIKIPSLNFQHNYGASTTEEDEERQPDTRKPTKIKVVDPRQAQSLFGGDESPDSLFDVTFDEGTIEAAQASTQGADLPEGTREKMAAGGGRLGGVTLNRQPIVSAPPGQEGPAQQQQGQQEPVEEEEPQGLFDDVTSIDARQERERQAFADELAARKAEEIQRTEARAGLGGMGLSGATSELVGDVARQAERAGDIAMSDLARRQQQETFDELRRQASIWTFEEEFGVDLDGDGKIGSGGTEEEGGIPEGVLPPEAHANAPSSREGTILKPFEVAKDTVAEFTGRGDVDLTAAPGHPENPIEGLPPSGVDYTYERTDDQGRALYYGSDGNYYTFVVNTWN